MHIAITLEHLSAQAGGAEAFAVTVARQLLARGHRMTLCAADGEPLPGMDVRFGPLSGAPAVLASVSPDVVVDWGLNVPADLHRLGGGTHREFQRLVLQSRPLAVRWVKRLLYTVSRQHRRLARHEADLLSRPGVHVLAVSQFVAEQVRRTVSLPEARLHVLHNGVDTRRFAPATMAAERTAERTRLGLADGHVAFLLAAHNLGLKGFDLLRDVFEAAYRQAVPARLVLLGRRDPGVRAPWFVYAGATRRPETVYAAVDALLHPTYYDACANVVLEALAAGLPVVSSDRNGSAEVLTHGDDGLVLPVVGSRGRIHGLWLKTVCDLSAQPDLRARLGSRARQRAVTLTIEAYVDRFEDLLRQVAAARAAC